MLQLGNAIKPGNQLRHRGYPQSRATMGGTLRTLVEVLKRALRRGYWSERMQALRILAALPGAELCKHAEEIKNRALQDADCHVRMEALMLLARLPGDELRKHAEEIKNKALQDADRDVRGEAVRTLARLPGKELCKHAEEIKNRALQDGFPSVRQEALRTLARLPGEELCKHAEEIKNRALQDGSCSVRKEALRTLARLPGDELCKHAEEIKNMVPQDGSWFLRKAALRTLARLPGDELCKHAEEIKNRALQDADWDVRGEALRALARLPGDELRKHAEEIKNRALQDADCYARGEALRALARLPGDELCKHAEEIKNRALQDADWDVRGEALRTLARLPGEELCKHAEEVTEEALEHEDAGVREGVLLFLGQLAGGERYRYAKRIMQCVLQDEDMKVREAAGRCLAKALQEEQATSLRRQPLELKYPGQEISTNEDMMIMRALHSTDSEIRQMALKCLAQLQLSVGRASEAIAANCLSWGAADVRLATELLPLKAWQKLSDPEYMSRTTLDGRLTLLHQAASQNKLELCKALVEHAGVAVRPRDAKGREPYQLTTCRAVDTYLRSQICLVETRFGSGDAMAEAKADDSNVVKLTWYTIPLPGFVGKMGGEHSFVHAVTRNSTARSSYILEKARPRSNDHDGTFVSYWQGSNGVGVGADLVSGAKVFRSIEGLKEGVKMNDLIEISKRVGAYRLLTCNCHHIALEVFNHCCAEVSQEVPRNQLPNRTVALVCGYMIGAGSASTSSGSGSATSRSKSDGSSHGSAGGNVPLGFNTEFDLEEGVYAYEAAFLSDLVYDDKMVECRLQMPELQPGNIRVQNRLTKTIRLKRRDQPEKVHQKLLQWWTKTLYS